MKHSVVERLQARLIESGFNPRLEEYLLAYQLPQYLQLTDLNQRLREGQVVRAHLLLNDLVIFEEFGVEVAQVRTERVVQLLQVLVEVLVVNLAQVLLLLRDAASSDSLTVDADEVLDSIQDVVGDQLVEADQETRS